MTAWSNARADPLEEAVLLDPSDAVGDFGDCRPLLMTPRWQRTKVWVGADPREDLVQVPGCVAPTVGVPGPELDDDAGLQGKRLAGRVSDVLGLVARAYDGSARGSNLAQP
jgi:hypothetical protein